MLPEVFSGDGNFDEWISHFESVSAVNGWTEDENLLWIRVRLTGKAHVAHAQLPHETQQTYAAVKDALRERFEPESKRELYKVQFENRRKQKEESWADFGDDLMALVNKAFPRLQEEAREQLAISKYMDQLRDPQISFGVKQRRPVKLREAVAVTIELESYLPRASQVSQVTKSDEPPVDQHIAAVQSTQQNLLGAVQKLVERVERLELGTRNNPRHRTQNFPQRGGRGVVTCFRCGKEGHYARGCAMQGQRANLQVPPENTRHPHTPEQSSHSVSINNVSSYVLSCSIYGCPVSFLVDTGAGVSLLNKEVWSKIKPTVELCELATSHRLVGVDGAPLNILGSAVAPITISGITYKHKFVIAERITADAILGLDFLEANQCVLNLAEGKIIIANRSIPLLPNSSTTKICCSKITLTETLTIPPRSEMEITGQIHSNTEGTWLIEQSPSSKLPVFIARTLVNPRDQSVVLRVANTDVSEVTLYKNSTLAKAELIDHTAICSALGENEELPTAETLEKEIMLSFPDDITETQKEQFLALLSHYSEIIANGPDDLGHTTVMQHHIDTGNASPIRQQARRIPLPRRETVRKLLDEMLKKDIISPSKSPWASPIVLVTKKDGSIRFCIDYRKVNSVTHKDAYPLPRVDDTLDTLVGSVWFSTIDLKSGYWQVEVSPEHREKTAFCTQEGLFEFNVMPFGLCNAPATFQRLMDCVLAGLQWTNCLVYIDDIIIMGRSFDDHLHNLQQVFDRLKLAGLKLHPDKCQFLQHQVHFLGHIVSAKGVAPDPSKTAKVKEWPTPTSAQETQRFLGLANYYRRFIKDFATIAKPLHQATEKHRSFTWTDQCTEAFSKLKQFLTSAPILALPDWSKPFIVDTDASDTGIGAVLSQCHEDGKEHVISYASRLLTKPERNYCVTRKELLAVITFLHHFRQYLIGAPFVIRTDHGALTWLQNFKSPEGQLARWLEKLQEYNFTIVHRPGRKHNNADALSRLPCQQCGRNTEDTIASISSSTISGGYSSEEIRCMQLDDKCLGELLQAKESHQKPSQDHSKSQSTEYRRLYQQWDQLIVRSGVLWRYYAQPNEKMSWFQLIVPQPLRSDIMKEAHEGISGGHLGQEKTLHRIKQRFYWPGYFNDVRNWCASCCSCTTRKTPAPSRHAPMGTITAGYPMQIVAADLLGPLPESENGNSYILVVADYFTRWMEAFPLPNQEATTVANKLVDDVFLRFSIPEQLHTDQGRQFESQLLHEVCKLLNIHKTRTTPYHPQSDGLVERFNRTLLNMLSTCAYNHPFDWEHHLRKVCMAYNSSVQSSTGYTPFYLMFGRQAQLPIDIIYRPTHADSQTAPLSTNEYASLLQTRLRTAFDLVREHASTNHQRQKAFYDQKVHGKPYMPGDLVWFYSSVPQKGSSRKLYHPWTGPFKVVKRISDVTYRIQQLQGKRKRKIVHFDHLKPCSSKIQLSPTNGPPMDLEDTSAPPDNPTSVTHTFGNHTELLDDDDNDAPPQVIGTPTIAVRRYPTRARRPPQRLGDYISH